MAVKRFEFLVKQEGLLLSVLQKECPLLPPAAIRKALKARDVRVNGIKTEANCQVYPGDRLLLYTDGVVDGGCDVISGLASLRSTAVALRSQPTDGLARRLVESVRVPGPDGDATLLVARLAPTA